MNKILRYSFVALMAMVGMSLNAQVTFDATVDKGTHTSSDPGEDQITKDGITIAVSNGCMNLTDQYRCYKNATFTVTSTVGNISKVEITCTAEGTEKYGPGCFTDATAGTYAFEGAVGTWTGDAATFTLTASTNQVRITKAVVTVAGGGGGGSTATFSWEGAEAGATVSGGTVVGNGADAESVNYQNGEYWTIRLSSKKANIDTDNITVTLNEALKGGEEIDLYAYINKGESKQASAFFLFENGTELEGEIFGDEENIGMSGAPATKTSTVPAEAAGSKVIKMARSKTQTNLFIIKMTIKSGSTGINTVKTVRVDDGAIYNLAGQKVDKSYKGVVIMNGKKMVQK